MPHGSLRIISFARLIPPAAFALLASASCGGSSTARQVTAIGSGWYVDHMRVSDSGQSRSRNDLRRLSGKDTLVVDEGVDRYQFYAPDCVVYSATRGGEGAGGTGKASWFAVCGDRTPVPLPTWVLEPRDDGVWGGYVARKEGNLTVERWEMAPIDSVRELAMKQGRRRKGWASLPAASRPAKLTKVFVETPAKP